jgi:hypothetical protein
MREDFPLFEKILHPVLTDLRVFGREPLRGGFRRERAVHLTKRWKIFSTTDPYVKGFSRLVSSVDALWLHNEMDFEKGIFSPILVLWYTQYTLKLRERQFLFRKYRLHYFWSEEKFLLGLTGPVLSPV